MAAHWEPPEWDANSPVLSLHLAYLHVVLGPGDFALRGLRDLATNMHALLAHRPIALRTIIRADRRCLRQAVQSGNAKWRVVRCPLVDWWLCKQRITNQPTQRPVAALLGLPSRPCRTSHFVLTATTAARPQLILHGHNRCRRSIGFLH